ncbi:MAG: hypothetical protein KGL39_53045 [Patescibacteria group bacterium]|nr:hypothetical protein [Patescibacteria group bacterium]
MRQVTDNQGADASLSFNTSKKFAGERSTNSDAMRDLAARLEREADRLRAAAQHQDERSSLRADRDRRARIIARAAARAAHGSDDCCIVDSLARELQISESTAAAVLADERRRHRRAALAQRDRLILQLAWKGWTNAQIAARVSLSEKHVSRIVARRLRVFEHRPGARAG